MPTFESTSRHLRRRSFDTEIQNNTGEESTGVGPVYRNGRRSVPYVNERREFDPRYDPRNPEILEQYQQSQQRKDNNYEFSTPSLRSYAGSYNDNEETVLFEDQRSQRSNNSNNQRARRSLFSNRVTDYFSQRKAGSETTFGFDNDANGNDNLRRTSASSFFRSQDSSPSSGLFDRPFDEQSSNEASSSSATDSLEEMLRQDSFASSTETSEDDGSLYHVLSAIEERPSIETRGSLSYSLTQANPSYSVTSYEDPALGFMSTSETVLSHDSEERRDDPAMPDGEERKERPQSPMDTQSTSQTLYYAFGKNAETQLKETKEELDLQSEPERRNERSVRSPLRKAIEEEMSKPPSRSSLSSSPRTEKSASLAPSAASSILTLSDTAREQAEKIVRDFNSNRRQELSKDMQMNHTNNEEKGAFTLNACKSTSAPSEDETNTLNTEEKDLALHDICGEANSNDDVAWRNAMYLLSMQPNLAFAIDSAGWTPLHVACLGSSSPPSFMIRSLLYVNRNAARKVDGGGRLPLHLVAASSGDPETMQLLVDEYPQAVHQTDCQGWTPLHLMLKNFSVDITLEHCRVLLGLTIQDKKQPKSPKLLQRRGDHLKLPIEEVGLLVQKSRPVSKLAQEQIHESAFRSFPADIQASLRRLYQWKRKQRRSQQVGVIDDDGMFELNMTMSMDAETNPAAYYTPYKHQLPLHIIVRRGLSEVGREGARYSVDDDDELDDMSPKFLELVRLFIAIYSEALVARDMNGCTPLMIALSTKKAQLPMELLELLLGNRTAGFNHLPEWARNMPLYSFTSDSGRYINPAMIPNSTQQLPIHVIAEEYDSPFSMLSSVYERYPGAIQVQDARGRTPLHLLLGNHHFAPPDSQMIVLLLSDKVAQIHDNEGKLPFDLLVEGASNLPPEGPNLNNSDTITRATDTSAAFQELFRGTISASSNKSKNQLGSDFLWKLRSLPRWLRRQACSTVSVQELLIEELASPLKCACIMLYAVLLGLLIVFFHRQMEDVMETEGEKPVSRNHLVVYASASGLFFFQILFWSLCTSMADFVYNCVYNFWRWVDLATILLCIATTLMANHLSVSDKVLLTTGTAATGMLWLSLIGFASTWWYGAAVFLACIQKVSCAIYVD